MKIIVSWDNLQKTALLWDMHKNWTLEDFGVARAQSAKMIEEIDLQFDLIINANGHNPPKLAMTTLHNALINASPKQRLIVIVNSSLLGNALIQVLKNIGVERTEDDQMYFVDTLEQARSVIMQNNTSRAC